MLNFGQAKRADETIKVQFSFARMMALNEKATDVGATADTLEITNVVVSPTGKAVICLVAGGSDGTDYPITFTMTTSEDQSLKEDVQLSVRTDPENPDPAIP